jgi:hypothetical protein
VKGREGVSLPEHWTADDVAYGQRIVTEFLRTMLGADPGDEEIAETYKTVLMIMCVRARGRLN